VKAAKLVENKSRKRGGAAAAPRAKRVAPQAETSKGADAANTASEQKATKRASKKKATKSEE
jgi:hypothetical protein